MEHNKNTIKCPHCGGEVDITTAMQHQIENQVEQRLKKRLIAEFDEKYLQKIKNYENSVNEKYDELRAVTDKKDKELATKEQELRNLKKIEATNTMLQNKLDETEANSRLQIERAKSFAAKEAREKAEKEWEELRKSDEERIRKESELSAKHQLEMELSKIQMQRQNEFESQLNNEKLKYSLEINELKTQLEQTNKKMEEAQKTAKQGSMQVQGEAQEKLLGDILKELFPTDNLKAKTTGKAESDIEQNVINNGKHCGVILYESKNTKIFQNTWIDKLKIDGLTAQADILVIVTQTMPNENKQLHRKDGVWICPITAFEIVAQTLRDGLIMVNKVAVSQHFKEEKMSMLYDYMCGNEFQHYMNNIIKGIAELKRSYDDEKNKLTKLWKQREKQFEIINNSATCFIGAIMGISDSIPKIEALELSAANEDLLDE